MTGGDPKRWSTRQHAQLVLAQLVLAVACAPEATLPPGTFDSVKIGVVVPLTGSLSADAPAWRDAARLAALEINAAGGVLPGRPLELVIVDDGTDPSRAQDIARELIEGGAAGIVGGAASSVSLGIAEVATEARVPQISYGSTSDRLTQLNENITDPARRFFFRTIPPDAIQSIVVAIAAEDLGCTRLAILHQDDSYGEPFGIGIEQSFTTRGGTVVARVPFADRRSSYTAELAMIRDAAPDCVAMVAFPASGGQILRDWSTLAGAPDVTWIGTDGVRQDGFVDEVGNPALLDGFYGTSPVSDPPTPEYNAFAARYDAVFGAAPVSFAPNTYDAVAVLALAIAHAGTTDGPAVRDAIHAVASPPSDSGPVRAGSLGAALRDLRDGKDIDYQGAVGGVEFDPLGNSLTRYEIWRYDAPGVAPCADATPLEGNRGSFCRFRTFSPEEILE